MPPEFTVSGIVSRPAAQVHEAIADPAQLSRYFTTGGAQGRLDAGATVTWAFGEFPGAFPVTVVEAAPGQRLVLRWGVAPEVGAGETTVTFTLKEVAPGRTQVQITEEGWPDTPAGRKASYGNCMGWSQFLSALKAHLEYGINLREGMYA